MPQPTELYERPVSVHSGPPIKHKVVVQHRSDLLLEEQVEHVKEVQAALNTTLTELELASNEHQVETLKMQVANLWQRADEMMLILKIIHKINCELVYARLNLQQALKAGLDSSVVNTARKRVSWLEERIERLLGKERQRSTKEVGVKSDAGESHFSQGEQGLPLLDSSFNKPSVGGSLSDLSSMMGGRDPLLLSGSGSFQLVPGSFRGSGDSEGPTLDEISHRKSVERFETSEKEKVDLPDVKKEVNKDRKRKNKEKRKLFSSTLEENGTSKETEKIKENVHEEYQNKNIPESVFVTQLPIDHPSGQEILSIVKNDMGAATVENPVMGQTDSLSPVVENDRETPCASRGTESSHSTEPSPFGIGVHIAPAPTIEPRDGRPLNIKDKRTSPDPRSRPTSNSEGESVESSEYSDSEVDDGSSQLTSVPAPSVAKSHKSKGSRVTIRTPTELEDLLNEGTASTISDMDEPLSYWQSEHHRFLYGEHADALCELNPLSYHQVGLAVPGTFVDDVSNRNPALPWQPKRSATEVTDIHRIALDKLAIRLSHMYDRIRDAALLSVNPTNPESGISSNLLSNLDHNQVDEEVGRQVKVMEKSGPSKPTMAKFEEINRPSSKEPVVFPPLDKERIGSSYSNRLLYYPKPLPYPDKLPISRTNRSQEFPRSPQTFSGSIPGKHEPAERIVNQRNLLQETKFTSSLYRPKPAKANKMNVQNQNYQLAKENTVPTSIAERPKAKFRNVAKTTVAVVKVKVCSNDKWNMMKPHSGTLEHSGLKWERVKGIVHDNLVSPTESERIDAARHLGALQCGDTMVLFALKERLKHEESPRVKYEACRSLAMLGCWEDDVMQALGTFLTNGNQDIHTDLLKAMSEGKNVQYVDKKMKGFVELSGILSELCISNDPNNLQSYNAAICLAKLCVIDSNACSKLKQVVTHNKDTHTRAKALQMLVHQMSCSDWPVVEACLEQLRISPVWKYRKDAAKLLIILGPDHVCIPSHVESVYSLLERRLWDEPNMNVRLEVARALAALDMFPKACELAEKRLEDQAEDVRARAVISLGTLGMKNERILRVLLEMLELDSSEFVRVMILRTFGVLKTTDKRVVRVLRDKEKLGDGPLSREARKVMGELGLQPSQQSAKTVVKDMKRTVAALSGFGVDLSQLAAK